MPLPSHSIQQAVVIPSLESPSLLLLRDLPRCAYVESAMSFEYVVQSRVPQLMRSMMVVAVDVKLGRASPFDSTDSANWALAPNLIHRDSGVEHSNWEREGLDSRQSKRKGGHQRRHSEYSEMGYRTTHRERL